MSDTAWMGIKCFFTGLFGNIGVLIYAWFTIPEIFNRESSMMMKNTIFGQISYGDLSNCIYMIAGLGLLFIITGILFVFDKKHFI